MAEVAMANRLAISCAAAWTVAALILGGPFVYGLYEAGGREWVPNELLATWAASIIFPWLFLVTRRWS